MGDDWRDANQIYGCLMVPPTPADDDSQAEPRSLESSVAARFIRRSRANADFERRRVVVARIVHAISFVHVPRGRHYH
ncbi:MAG TPA: hypothetical protein VFU34_06070 [Gaiellaceae bacterium]|nr:hypothetical protein [Gaiellaceae bacterium]